jgi:hypothetical protein
MYRLPVGLVKVNSMNKRTIRWLVVGTCALGMAGCITHRATIVRDTERTKVEFENETAGRIFYEALSKMCDDGSHRESTTKIDLILIEHEEHVVRGQNAKFNEAVARCDTNKGGKITEVEAKIFADQVGRR